MQGTILTGLAMCAHWYNIVTNATGVTNDFLTRQSIKLLPSNSHLYNHRLVILLACIRESCFYSKCSVMQGHTTGQHVEN